MWSLYAVGDTGSYVTNVKCVYTSAFSDIVDCIDLIWGIYTDIVVWYMQINKLVICGIEVHICCCQIYGF